MSPSSHQLSPLERLHHVPNSVTCMGSTYWFYWNLLENDLQCKNMSGGTFFLQGLDTNLPQAFLLLEISPLAQPQGPAWIEEGWSKWMMGDMTRLTQGLTGKNISYNCYALNILLYRFQGWCDDWIIWPTPPHSLYFSRVMSRPLHSGHRKC